MKYNKYSKLLLAILVTLASISAQYYINSHQQQATTPRSSAYSMKGDSTENHPRLQLDIEIVKTIIQHSTSHIPVIGTPNKATTLD